MPSCLLRLLTAACAALVAACAALVAIFMACVGPAHAQTPPQRDVTVALTFFASAEHGGYYAALAEGIYEKAGLNVKITQVGPQANNMQLVVADRADFGNGWTMRTLNAAVENIPLVSVAAIFQRDPQCLVMHAGAYRSPADMKGALLRISMAARGSFWPWLKAKYGLDDAQLRPFDVGYAPLLQNPKMLQQGYITNEEFHFRREKLDLGCMLLADFGWNSYQYSIDTSQRMVREHPKVVADFVRATIEGWHAFLRNPEPASRLIKANNPQMTDAQIAFSIGQLRKYGLLDTGDAAGGRIGIMTQQRIDDFYLAMVNANALPAGLDTRRVFDLRFIRQIYP